MSRNTGNITEGAKSVYDVDKKFGTATPKGVYTGDGKQKDRVSKKIQRQRDLRDLQIKVQPLVETAKKVGGTTAEQANKLLNAIANGGSDFCIEQHLNLLREFVAIDSSPEK